MVVLCLDEHPLFTTVQPLQLPVASSAATSNQSRAIYSIGIT